MIEAVASVSSFVPDPRSTSIGGMPSGLEVASGGPPATAQADALQFAQATEASRVGSVESSRVELEEQVSRHFRPDRGVWMHLGHSVDHGMSGLSAMEEEVNRLAARDMGAAGAGASAPARGAAPAFNERAAGSAAPGAEQKDRLSEVEEQSRAMLEESRRAAQQMVHEQWQVQNYSVFATFTKGICDTSTHTIEKLANGGNG